MGPTQVQKKSEAKLQIPYTDEYPTKHPDYNIKKTLYSVDLQ